MSDTCILHGEENCLRCALSDSEFVAPTIHVGILLDFSTSMLSRWSQTVSGLNEYIAALRVDGNKYKMTITTFGLEDEVNDLYTDEELDNIAKFDEKTFRPNGRGTALWSATGITLRKINTTEPVLFIVITDGEENSSHVYTSKSVDELIEDKKKLGNYTFAYMGVDKAAWGQEVQVAAFAGSNRNMTSYQYADTGSGSTYSGTRSASLNSDGSTHYNSGLAALTANYSKSVTRSMSVGGAASVSNLFDEEALEAAVQAGEIDVPTTTVPATPNK